MFLKILFIYHVYFCNKARSQGWKRFSSLQQAPGTTLNYRAAKCVGSVESEFPGVQQIEGSSTAAAPSVAALTHLAIVWEARLIESKHREGARIGRLFHTYIFYLLIRYFKMHTCHVEVLYCKLGRYQRSSEEVLLHSLIKTICHITQLTISAKTNS